MTNRVLNAIDAARVALTGVPAPQAADLDAAMAVTFTEHYAFQDAQARAHASAKLTTDEAQIIYGALGEVGSVANGGWAAGTDLATKVTVTRLMGELLVRA